MSLTAIPFKLRKCVLLLLILSYPALSLAQEDCPPPTSVQVLYDPYENEWESSVIWIGPSAPCPIQGYEIEYADYDFIPGTGAEQGSLITEGWGVTIPTGINVINPSLYVYVRTLCEPPCDGPFGGGSGEGASSGWVLADVFIAPPPPPPPSEGAGDCSDAADPPSFDNSCFNQPDFYFWEPYAAWNSTTNPCSGEEEYMIWQEYISPPLGEVSISGIDYDLDDWYPGPEYTSFGMVVYAGNCGGPLLVCDTSMTENDTITISLPPGETFVLGAWFNAEYDELPNTEIFDGLGLALSVCEPVLDCTYPTDISFSNVTDHTVEIEWDDSQGSTWMLEFGPQGFTPGTGTEVTIESESPYLLDSLDPETDYGFYLQTLCTQHGSNSISIGPTNFTTPASMTIEGVPDGHLYCCDDIIIPETSEAEAFCDSIYFTHNDSLVGNACPYTIYRTITAHDTCGNSISTSFSYDILDNAIPCSCESETVIEQEEDEHRGVIHGDWAVLQNGDIGEIYHFEDGSWTLHDTLYTSSIWVKSLAIYDDVIVEENNVYRLVGDTWTLETTLEPSVPTNASYHKVAIYENTLAYELGDSIFIFEYADETWLEVALIPHGAYSLDLGEDVLLTARQFDDHIGRVYRKTDGIWAFEQELTNFFPDNNGNGIAYDASIDGNYAAIGYRWGGGLFTYEYNGTEWEPDEFLTNPYQVYPGGGYATCFGNAVDIEDDLMVVGDYFNAVNGGFSGSVAVFERSCGQWAPQRNIVPSNGMEDQRFGGCLDLQGGRLVVGIDTQYWLGGITYDGIGHYWFYECLESDPTYSLTTDSEIFVNCVADIPPEEDSYTLGNAWCTSTVVVFESDTTGSDCSLLITREITVSDSLGNAASAVQQITFIDDQAPEVIEAPEDINLTCLADLEEFEPEFVDNCSDTLQVIFNSDTAVSGCNTIIEQSWSAIDDCGNSTDVSRTIAIDYEPPYAAIVPEDLTLSCIEDFENNNEPVFFDSCTDSLQIIFESDTIGDDCSLIVQSWTAVNQCGGSTTVSRTITVENEPPVVVSAPEDLNITCDENWELEVPEFTDDCTAELDVTFSSDTLSSSCPVIIEHQWIAMDLCGSTTEVTRTITIDDFPSVISTPENVSVNCSETEWEGLEDPVFSGGCSGGLTVSLSTDTIVNECSTIYSYLWTAVNGCGEIEVNRTLTISDMTPPEVISSPPNLAIPCTEEPASESASFSDNCSEDLQIVETIDTLLNDGCTTTIEYTWEATDACGNSTSTQRTINIVDEEQPTFECPDDFTVFLPSDSEEYSLINLLDSVSTEDNCAEIQLSQSLPPGTPLEPGNYNISISATDGCFSLVCFVGIEVVVETGVENRVGDSISIFPNPTSGKINIQLPKAEAGEIELFDMTGKKVLSNAFNSRLIELDLKHLPTGIYTVQVITDGYRVVRKVVLE